jgi:hypothetical protein
VVFNNILDIHIMASNLKRVSEILHDMVEEFKKSNDEWEKRYGQSDVLRPSDDGTGSDRSKQIHNGGKQDGSL